MELNDRFKELMSEITRQEEIIENYASKLEEAGNIDQSIEEYLANTREELKQRKAKLIEEFTPKKPVKPTSSKPKSIKASANEGDDSPKVKVKCNTPSSKSSRAEKFPFSSVCQIEVEKPTAPKLIFKASSSNSRGNSPAAARYSPRHSPMQDVQRRKTQETKKKHKFTGSSTDCSINLFENPAIAGNDYFTTYRKYQELREIKNKAHEEMLALQQKMLDQREMELNDMIEFLESQSKSITFKRGNLNDNDKSSESNDSEPDFEKYETVNLVNAKIKPPVSPTKVSKASKPARNCKNVRNI